MNKPPTWTIHQGDALAVLRTLPSESVHCVVTSPPYWGLRDYGTGTWTGGNPDCQHTSIRKSPGSDTKNKQGTNVGSSRDPIRSNCRLCGATREDNQIGLESTPDGYVAKMVEIFVEVRRVLRKDGTCWLNLGDSYVGGGGFSVNAPSTRNSKSGKYGLLGALKSGGIPASNGLKPKDLVGIPWMVAFALRSDGWYLRSDIIWSKPNPMPESVTDRPTKSHEYLFLLTKSERYYFDQDAVREPPAPSTLTRVALRDVREGNAPSNGDYKAGQGRGASRGQHADHLVLGSGEGRNIRSVWTIPTKPFPEAHFATFPPELVRTCLLAGVSEKGACSNCGNPMVRIVEKIRPPLRSVISETAPGQTAHGLLGVARFDEPIQVKTIGWEPSCKCDAPTVPATILDPFSGSGTTGVVATRMGYNYIGIELNPEYVAMSERRLEAVTQQHGVFV